MRKDDVQFHGLGYGYRSVPAVNVKVHEAPTETLARQVALDGGASDREAQDFGQWAMVALEDERISMTAWEAALESAWDDLQDIATEIYGRGTKVYSEGRSGGWAYIDGMTAEDVEGWDAIELAKWAKFARIARAYADDVPYQMCSFLLLNVWPFGRTTGPIIGQEAIGL